MSHLYRAEEWELNGHWYCNDVKELNRAKSIASFWWTPARILNIPLIDYIQLLIKDFNVSHISYNEEKDVLVFWWNKQTDMRRYKNYINKIARNKNFIC